MTDDFLFDMMIMQHIHINHMERRSVFEVAPQQFLEKKNRPSFNEQVESLYRSLYQDSFIPSSVQSCEDAGRTLQKRERYVEEQNISDFLRKYGISMDEIRETSDGYFEIQVKNHFSSERLPDGYAYKGGAARALLLRALDIDSSYIPRDLDIVRTVDNEPFPDSDRDVAIRYMSDDFQHGHGVELLKDQDEYFRTRDLTINELLATDEKIIASRQAIMDSVRHVIRVTEHEKQLFGGKHVGQKMLSKILRFYAEAIYRYDDASIEDVEDWEFEEYFISPFWLALQLDRSADISTEVAEVYISELKKRNQLPNNIDSIEAAANYLVNLMKEEGNIPFYYRHAPTEQFDLEAEWFEEQFDSSRDLKKMKGY